MNRLGAPSHGTAATQICSLSPYLFVTAVNILAIAIRNHENTTGITLDGLETKILQFVNDTTAVPSDLNSA